ncbi:MAG: hypothetical protein OEU94_16745, partial [Aquincola sp.]|nr:hypothetical protein [Aquincola sp.]
IDLPELLDSVRPDAASASAEMPGGQSASAAPARPPLVMQPMPAVKAAEAPASTDPALASYVRKCGELKGMVSCCVFELASQRTIASASQSSGRPGPAALATHGASLMASMAEAAHALHLGDAPPDAAITLDQHHLLIRTVPGRRGLAMHAVLDKAQANLTLVRLQLQRLDIALEEGATR